MVCSGHTAVPSGTGRESVASSKESSPSQTSTKYKNSGRFAQNSSMPQHPTSNSFPKKKPQGFNNKRMATGNLENNGDVRQGNGCLFQSQMETSPVSPRPSSAHCSGQNAYKTVAGQNKNDRPKSPKKKKV